MKELVDKTIKNCNAAVYIDNKCCEKGSTTANIFYHNFACKYNSGIYKTLDQYFYPYTTKYLKNIKAYSQ